MARTIVQRRAQRPFDRTGDLVAAVTAALGPARGRIHPATRTFQALRIAVNDELGSLERGMPVLRDRLSTSGVLAVIAYHSGEDRIVKHTMREWSQACICPPRQLQCSCGGRARGALVNRKAIKPSPEEIERNPRARSARLRAWRSAA